MVTNIYDTLGYDLKELLNNDDVVEISLNDNGEVFVKKSDGISIKKDAEKTNIIINEERAMLIIKEIMNYGSIKLKDYYYSRENYKFNGDNPSVISAVLPNRERFEGIISTEGVTLKQSIFRIIKPFDLRKKITLNDYKNTGVFTEKQLLTLTTYVNDDKNILVTGIVATGKSTFLNAYLREVEKINKEKNGKIVVIQHIPEVILEANNSVELLAEYGKFDEAIRIAKVLNPDRLIIDDMVDGLGMYELIQTLDTGMKGVIFSIRASDENRALAKINSYINEVWEAEDDYIEQVITNIDLIVLFYKTALFERKAKLIKIKGYDKNTKKYILEEIK